MRKVSEKIRATDRLGCEVACAAQLAWMFEVNAIPTDPATVDRMVGRKRGENDLTHGALGLLLKAGFKVWEITSANIPLVEPEAMAYLGKRWRSQGVAQGVIDRELPNALPIILQRVRVKAKLTTAKPSQYRRTTRTPRAVDLELMLKDGWVVQCALDLMGSAGTRAVLVTGNSEYKGDVDVYDPVEGMYAMSISDLMTSGGNLGLTAFRLG